MAEPGSQPDGTTAPVAPEPSDAPTAPVAPSEANARPSDEERDEREERASTKTRAASEPPPPERASVKTRAASEPPPERASTKMFSASEPPPPRPVSEPPPPERASAKMRAATAEMPERPLPEAALEPAPPPPVAVPPAPVTAPLPDAPVAVSRSAPPAPRTSDRPHAQVPSTPPVANATPLDAYEALARSARLPDLVAVATKVFTEAATLRPSGWSFAGRASAAADDAKLSRLDAETPFGNALKVLESGPEGEAERALASALFAHVVAEGPRGEQDSISGDVLWFAAHTAFDATPLLDRALGEDADDLWAAIADRIRRTASGRGTSTGRGEAIVGCAALASSASARARDLAADLASRLGDPVLLRMLAPAPVADTKAVRLEGELVAPPRGPVATTLLAMTGILFAMHAVGLVARLALGYKRPTEAVLSADGVRLKTRIEMLGKVLKEREHVIVRSGLVRVVREVRYPRVAFYAGLLALALGSYVGVRAFADGVRAASPSLLGVGLVIIALGVAADFVLGTLLPGSRGRCRVAFVPRSGATLAIGDVDAKRADDALAATLK